MNIVASNNWKMFTDTKLCSLNGVAHPLTHIYCSLSSHSFFCSTKEEWTHYYNIESDFMRKPIHFCRLNKMSSVYLLRHICIIYIWTSANTHRESGVWLPPMSAYSSGERHSKFSSLLPPHHHSALHACFSTLKLKCMPKG